jgi:DNA polymerase III sliding clamp (beta) subunit (PCNA family)
MNARGGGVRLRRLADGLEIQGEKPDAGVLTITIAASGWKKNELLGVNLGYLHDGLRFARSANLTIGITDESHPIKIADSLYLALIMPIRLEKGEIR